MELDEKLFHFIWGRYRFFKKKKENRSSVELVKLSNLLHSLNFFACAQSGDLCDVKEVHGVGACSQFNIYLPKTISVFEEKCLNADLYFYQVYYFENLARLYKQGVLSESENGPFERSIQSISAAISLDAKLEGEWPSLFKKWLILRRKFPHEAPSQVTCQNDFMTTVLAGYFSPHENSESWLTDALLENDLKIRTRMILHEASKRDLKPSQMDPLPPCWGLYNREIRDKKDDETIHKDYLASGTEEEGKNKSSINRRKDDDTEKNLNPVTNLMESAKTADEFDGANRKIDGSDELNQHLDALDELDLRDVTISDENTKSIYKADLGLSAAELDEAPPQVIEHRFHYDEWDGKRKFYRRDWCTLLELALPKKSIEQTDTDLVYRELIRKDKKLIKQLRLTFKKITLDRRWKNRQNQGEELDVDALVERFSQLKAGRSQSDRIYIRKSKLSKDIATQILLDVSMSTDSWVAGYRVMDLAKEAIIVLGEALKDFDQDLGISGFNSFTRKDCRFLTVKDFQEDWNLVKSRLHHLEPSGYTRMGPAIRHGTYKLSNTLARQQVLLIISDGKPTDYDVYEGKYGIEDVKKAIHEARGRGIYVFNLTIDKNESHRLSHMFGKHNFNVINQPERLAEILGEFYLSLI